MTIDGAAAPGPGAEALKRHGRESDTRLREAAIQFEAVFVQQMLAAMRDSLPEGGIVDGGHAEDVFASVLDGHLAELMAGESRSGLADAIYGQLSRGMGR